MVLTIIWKYIEMDNASEIIRFPQDLIFIMFVLLYDHNDTHLQDMINAHYFYIIVNLSIHNSRHSLRD
jgi:hypothetical protein